MRKVLPISLILVLALSMTSCSSIFSAYGRKEHTLLKAVKELDYEEADQDFFEELADNDQEDSDYEDGFYVVPGKFKPLKSMFDDYEDFDYKTVTKCLVAGRNIDEEDDDSQYQFVLLEFEDEETAEDFYDSACDVLEENVEALDPDNASNHADSYDEYVYEMDISDERCMSVVRITMEDYDLYLSFSTDTILDKNTVLMINWIAYSEDIADDLLDDYDAVYEAMNIASPFDELD